MAASTRKATKSKRKSQKKSVPRHVKNRKAQMAEMQSIIKNLLGPLAGRVNIFQAPPLKPVRKKKKRTRK